MKDWLLFLAWASIPTGLVSALVLGFNADAVWLAGLLLAICIGIELVFGAE